jgi:hypothetical protein
MSRCGSWRVPAEFTTALFDERKQKQKQEQNKNKNKKAARLATGAAL